MQNNFDPEKYYKIVLLFLAFGILVAFLCFCSLAPSYAAELEQETVYSNDDYILLEDGTIVPKEPETEYSTEESTEVKENEFENDLSDYGDSEPDDLLLSQPETDSSESLSGEEDSSDVQETEIPDTSLSIYADTVNIQPLPDDFDPTVMVLSGERAVVSFSETDVVLYRVRFDNVDYTAVFPVSASDSLVVCDGVLLNVGASTVTGRLFAGNFNTGSYCPDMVTLNSVFATASNTNAYRYGGWSFRTHYYPRQGAGTPTLDSDTFYGDFYVLEEPKAFSGMTDYQSIIVGILCFLSAVVILAVVRKEVKR